MCFFVNGLIMLNKHITISRMTIRASKQFSKIINKINLPAFELIIKYFGHHCLLFFVYHICASNNTYYLTDCTYHNHFTLVLYLLTL